MALYLARTQQFLPYNEKLSTALGGAVKDGDTLVLKLKPDCSIDLNLNSFYYYCYSINTIFFLSNSFFL